MSSHWRGLSKNRPFGFIMDNGMNFSQSIHNPKSVIRRMLDVVNDSPILLTRAEILRRMGYELGRKSLQRWNHYERNPVTGEYDVVRKTTRKITTNTRKTTRGYLSWYFSAAHKAGFLLPVRKVGNTVLWVKGNNFPNPALLVNAEG